jgi:autotransporter-associated beta strand protein
MKHASTALLAAGVLLAADFGSPSASAQEWALPGSGTWHVATTWNPQTVPDGIGAAASFASVAEGGFLTGTCSPTFNEAITLGSLFIDIGISNTPVLLNPPLLIMDNGGGADVFMTTDAAYNVQIYSDVVLMGTLITDWRASNGQISGSISGDYGIIHDTPFNSRIRLWGNNTYTGPTIARSGAISIRSAAGLGDHAVGTVVEAAGRLYIEGIVNPVISGEHVTLMDGGAIFGVSHEWADTITLDNGGRIAPWFDDLEVTVSGQLTGTGPYTRESAQSRNTVDPTLESILYLTNPANDYDGGTIIRAGVLSIADDAVLGLAGTGITFNQVGFFEGPPAFATSADITIPRDISMVTDGGLRADAGTTGTYSGVISGSRALNVGFHVWTGTVKLANANTYTGVTTVQAGTLLASNTSGSATGSGDVTVQPGAALGGNGSISGGVTIQNGATLAPGESAGELAAGALTLQPESTLAIEIGGTAAGEFDRVAVTGAAAIDGSLAVSLLPGYVQQVDEEFEIIAATSVSGTFATTDLPAGFEIEYQADRVVLRVTSVPVPCPADVNGDTMVDVTDLLALLAAWGPCPGCPEDSTGDGNVDVTDLLNLLAAWGACP